MTTPATPAAVLAPAVPAAVPGVVESARIAYLDAARAGALLLGIVFHASLSFLPTFVGWAVMDVSTSPLVGRFALVSHAFRMELFFLLAGFFSAAALRRHGTGAFLRARVGRLVVPFVIGWFLLRPLIVSGWIMGGASLRGEVDILAGLRGGFASLGEVANLFTGSHLWFLYYLALITALVVAGRAALRPIPSLAEIVGRSADGLAGWLARSAWALPALALPTAALLWQMDFWGMDTPDRTLRPHLPVLAVYSGCFLLGWGLSRSEGWIDSFGRLSWDRWACALVGILTTIRLSALQTDPSHPQYQAARLVFVVAYGLMMWALVALTLGLCRRLLHRPYSVVRYIADSSYWLYLAHLPIVVWLQVAVAELPFPWPLKLVLITGATLAIGLLSYHVGVRSTWIGGILNGRRRPRSRTFRDPAARLGNAREIAARLPIIGPR